jgi:hypothetical protein
MLQPNQVTRSLRRRCPKHSIAKHGRFFSHRFAPAIRLSGFKICLKLLAAHRHQIALLRHLLPRQSILGSGLLPLLKPFIKVHRALAG